MNLVGYLITLANLQSFDRSAGPITDLSIKVAEIQTLINDFKKYPEFNLQDFKKTGYYRQGKLGKYVSKNFRDYIYNGIGKATDEAIVLTLVFSDASGLPPTIINSPDKSLSYFLHRGTVDNDVKQGINEYVHKGHARNRRSLLNTLKVKV